MRLTEIFRLVWLNLASNKFKVILTSTGIIVGSATIMLVIAIGTGGREEVAVPATIVAANMPETAFFRSIVTTPFQ